jgi:uncharacterized low-complexity protein
MVRKKTALSLTIGTALATSVAAAPVANAVDNPFSMDSLKNGYQIVADNKSNEGKCGEGKCGGDATGSEAAKGNANRARGSNR